MKITVEVPDQLYRRIKARAAVRGQTVKAFFLDALQEKLAGTDKDAANTAGWRSVFGSVPAEEAAEIQRIIDEEFSKIDPEA